MAKTTDFPSKADADRSAQNWFTSVMEYTVRRETDEETVVELSELNLLTAAFYEERLRSLKDIAANYPGITTDSVELVEKQVNDVYPQAHELWSVLKQKRHFLENVLIKETEEHNQHVQDVRENLAVVEATIEVFEQLKVVHAKLDDAKAALNSSDFLKCIVVFEIVDDELLGFSREDSENIKFIGEMKLKLQQLREELVEQLKKAWNTALRFYYSATGRSSRDRIEIVFGSHAVFENTLLSAFRLNMLEQLTKNSARSLLNNLIARLFDSENAAVLSEEKHSSETNTTELLILFPADAEKVDALARACAAFELLHTVVSRLLQFLFKEFEPSFFHENRDLVTNACDVMRKMLSETLAVPLMQELVVEKCLQAFSTTSGAGSANTKRRMQSALTKLYDLFGQFDVACGSLPDISLATNLVDRSAIDSECDEFLQRARGAVQDPTLFRNCRTAHIIPDDSHTSTIIDQMLSTVQLVVTSLFESSIFLSSTMPINQHSLSKRSKPNAQSGTSIVASELRLQTSAALQELSSIADDVLASCGQASSQQSVNLYIKSICDIYSVYLELSPEMATSSSAPNGENQLGAVALMTFCSCAFYPQIIAEVKSKIEEVLRWNESVVMGNIDSSEWLNTFDERSHSGMLPKSIRLTESFVRLALQQQVDVLSKILGIERVVKSAAGIVTASSLLPGADSGIATAKLIKAATWLKQQPAAAALSTAASSLAASATSTSAHTTEMRALIDGGPLVKLYDHLEAVKTEWFGILPPRVALAMLSAFVDIVLAKLGFIVFKQTDISADDATAIAQNFKLFSRKLMLLYKSLLGGEAPTRHCTRWDWFNELAFVLEASMGDIDNRWSEGQGPLALHFGASQVILLVRVLFEKNERRQRLLDKLEYAASAERR